MEIRRWAVDEAKQVLDDAQKAMDEVTRDADEKIAEYKKTREETEKKLAEAESAAASNAATVASLEENEYVKRYKEMQGRFSKQTSTLNKLFEFEQSRPVGAVSDYKYAGVGSPSPSEAILLGMSSNRYARVNPL